MKLRILSTLFVLVFAFAGCESDTGTGGGGGGGGGNKDTSGQDVVAGHDGTSNDGDTIEWGDTGTPTPDADTTNPPDTTPDTTPDGTPTDTTPTDTTPEVDVPDTDTTDPGLSCKEFYMDCLPACPTGPDGMADQGCMTECQNNLSQAGTNALMAFQNCMQMNGCFNQPTDEALYDCLETNCMAEYLGCFSGDLSCSEMNACMGACPQGNDQAAQECISGCQSDGTPEAQTLLQDIIDCLINTCCPDDSAQCDTPEGSQCWTDAQSGECKGLIDDCFGGGTVGTMDCGEMLACFQQCGNDTACMQQCYGNSTAEAQ